MHSLESGPNSELNLPDGHWIFGGEKRLITDNQPITSQISQLQGYWISAGTWAHASKVLNPKVSPAHGPGSPGLLCCISPIRSMEYPIYPGEMHHFSCLKNSCIQKHCGAFNSGLVPLGNRIWHQKNGTAMATSRGKKTLSLFMARTCLVVFDSKNCTGSVSKCLHVWKRSYHRILFSLEQSQGNWRIQCWKQALLWGCCLGCSRRSRDWHWSLGNALWRPFTWKKRLSTNSTSISRGLVSVFWCHDSTKYSPVV